MIVDRGTILGIIAALALPFMLTSLVLGLSNALVLFVGFGALALVIMGGMKLLRLR